MARALPCVSLAGAKAREGYQDDSEKETSQTSWSVEHSGSVRKHVYEQRRTLQWGSGRNGLEQNRRWWQESSHCSVRLQEAGQMPIAGLRLAGSLLAWTTAQSLHSAGRVQQQVAGRRLAGSSLAWMTSALCGQRLGWRVSVAGLHASRLRGMSAVLYPLFAYDLTSLTIPSTRFLPVLSSAPWTWPPPSRFSYAHSHIPTSLPPPIFCGLRHEPRHTPP
jgi:hypothetical protein